MRRRPSNRPLQRMKASVASLPLAFTAERQYRWADGRTTMDFDSLRPLLSGLAGAALVFGLQRRAGRAMPQVVGDGMLLRHSRGLFIMGLVGVAIFLGFTVFNAQGGNLVSSYSVAVGVPFTMTIVAGWIALEAGSVSILLGKDFLRCTSPWRRTREIQWRDVVHASFSPTNGWYVLRTRNQGVVRVSNLLVGADTLPSVLAANGIGLD
jgi:hypothetical protein